MQITSTDRPFKQDPQSNLSMSIKEGICEVTFLVWDQNDQEIQGYKGQISFSHGWACEYVATEPYPYPDQKESCALGMFLWQLTQSDWFNEKIDKRTKVHPTWPDWDKKKYFHYLVEGHDNYIQIIASGFKIDLIPRD